MIDEPESISVAHFKEAVDRNPFVEIKENHYSLANLIETTQMVMKRLHGLFGKRFALKAGDDAQDQLVTWSEVISRYPQSVLHALMRKYATENCESSFGPTPKEFSSRLAILDRNMPSQDAPRAEEEDVRYLQHGGTTKFGSCLYWQQAIKSHSYDYFDANCLHSESRKLVSDLIKKIGLDTYLKLDLRKAYDEYCT